MRMTAKMTVAIGCLMILTQVAWGSELIGGYFNSGTREAALAIQSGRQRIQVMNVALKLRWGGAEYGSGKLFVVDFANRITEYRATFRDRTGVSIALPQGAYDKVVILNRYGNIAWAAGLDDDEILRLLPGDFQAQGGVIASAQNIPLFGALRYSSHVLREMWAPADEMADMLLISVRWMAGPNVEKLLRDMMEKNGPNFLKGVSLVAQGGDGSGGNGIVNPAAQGDDGSGGNGIVNPVAQGGDGSGGNGMIAQGGDGGGGNGLVNDLVMTCGVQDWGKMPNVRGLTAMTIGKIIAIQ